MAEYIEREEAIQIIKKNMNHTADEVATNSIVSDVYKMATMHATEYLRVVPAADVIEVVHGEWIETKYPNVYQCSECYYEWYVTGICRKTPIDNNAFYCPCCGAKMDGERKCEDDKIHRQ